MTSTSILRHFVQAYNLSASSENKIHDDAVAKKFGFQGGLVPGVEVYAYMIYPMLQHFGEEWLHSGYAECRLLKPVYDGARTDISGDFSDENLSLVVESSGEKCATGLASISNGSHQSKKTKFQEVELPEFEKRPKASKVSLPIGKTLGTFKQIMSEDDQIQYLQDVSEPSGIFKKEKIIHPGWILRMANRALSMNVLLGPWIHVGSKIQNIEAAYIGQTIAAHSEVTDLYERKGHNFVEIDVSVIGERDVFLTHIQHTAIYRPRQVTEAA